MNSLFEKISEGVKYQHRKEDLYWVGVFFVGNLYKFALSILITVSSSYPAEYI